MKRAAAKATDEAPSNRQQGRVLADQAQTESPASTWAKVGPGGRVVIPAAMRRALDLDEGTDVQIRMEGDAVQVVPRDVVVREVQDTVGSYLDSDKASVDSFLAERPRIWDEETPS